MSRDSLHDQGLEIMVQQRGKAKLNPEPKRGYGLVVTIENAPGPFAMIEGGAQYDVANSDACGYINESAGVIPRISSSEDIPLTRDASGEYRGTLYVDRMQDEDYFGRGICHWEPKVAYVVLRATGSEGETLFQPAIEMKDIIGKKVVERYFWKGGYPRSRTDNFPDSGSDSPDRVSQEIRGELFKVTIRSEGERQ